MQILLTKLMTNFSYYTKTITTITETPSKKQLLIKLNCQLAKLTHSSHYKDALHLFDEIHSSRHRLKPDHYTLSTALTASANLHNTRFGNQLHAYAIRAGLKPYPHVSNTLLSLYAKARDLGSVKRVFKEIENPDIYSWTTLLSASTKLGDVGYACEVFDKMPERGLAVWNAMITGCVENECEEIGIGLFRDMQFLGVKHDNYSLASVLSVCGEGFGRQVHSLVIKIGCLVRPSVVNALITMYFKCGRVADSYNVFKEAEGFVHDQITYNVMIDGLVSVGRVKEGFVMFKEMLVAGLRPTELTFVSLMSSCSYLSIGYQVEAKAIKMGFEGCTSVTNAAMTMFSTCGDLHAAQRIFERLEEKDLVSWNTMISSYGQGNFGELSILAYREMQRAEVEPDEFTFGSLLASSEFIETVEMIHTLVLKSGLISNIQASNALVSAYSKHEMIEEAYHIFCDMSPRNLISWNTIISGFLLNGFPMQGLEQFSRLLISELRPNAYTLSMALSICASISFLRHGKQVHGYILRHKLFPETSLGNALITMYAKSGVLDWSVSVFNQMIDKDTISWNALISAYAQHGNGEDAVRCFEAMKDAGSVNPDQATFTAVLSACSHTGLVEDGTRIFNSMVKDYRFTPGEDHFSCMVDLLGRAGYLDEAERVIKDIEADSGVWWTLFSACVAHGNIRLGRLVAGFLLETEQNNPSVYVLLSNLYATAGQWEEAANTRKLLKKTGVMKQPGCSWIGS